MKPFGHFVDRKIYGELVEVRSGGQDFSHSSFPYFLSAGRPLCNWLIVKSEATRTFSTQSSPGVNGTANRHLFWWKNSSATNIFNRFPFIGVIFPIRFALRDGADGENLMPLIVRNVLTERWTWGNSADGWKLITLRRVAGWLVQ